MRTPLNNHPLEHISNIFQSASGRTENFVRFSFYAVQLLDGFKTTNDNVNGFMPDFISKAGFTNVSEAGYINTAIGTYSYYTAIKSA